VSAASLPHIFVRARPARHPEFRAAAKRRACAMPEVNCRPIRFGRAGPRPAGLQSWRAAAPRAGFAVSAFGDDPSRERQRRAGAGWAL